MNQLPAMLRRALRAVFDWLHRNWRRALRVREKFRFREESIHLVLAGAVGVVGGLVNLLFYHVIRFAQMLAVARTDDLVTVAAELPPWICVVVPTVGGLVAGGVLFLGLRLVGQRGTPNLLEAVAAGDGRLPFRSAIIKSVSSVISIATGASIGREGSITQLTATLASRAGQWVGWHPYRLRLLVACGAAAGIAAAYNAPIAGAVFAAQIVLGNFSMGLFAPLVFASVVATMVSRTFFGIEPAYHVPLFEFTRLSQLPWFIVLGVLAGILGAVFLRLIASSEAAFRKLNLPLYARLALAGASVGGVAIWYPQVWGNGYSVASSILKVEPEIALLAGVLLAKLLATTLTVGAGTVGGVFTPTLFLGVGLGSLLGLGLNEFGLAKTLPNGVFGLVGMGALLAATTHSPLLAMIMVFEISLDYSLMPALMLACVVSSLVSRQMHPGSIYTEPLRRRGLIDGEADEEVGGATQQTVGELMRTPVPPLAQNATLPEMADRFIVSPNNFLPVVDAQQRLLGVVALQDLKGFLGAGDELRGVIAYDVMRPPPPCLTPNQRLGEAFPVLLASEMRNVPVVNSHAENRLIGSVPRAEVLGILSEAIERSNIPKR